MMEKKPTGAPRGNQNARKHGFYSRVLNEARKLQLVDARDVVGAAVSDEASAQHGVLNDKWNQQVVYFSTAC